MAKFDFHPQIHVFTPFWLFGALRPQEPIFADFYFIPKCGPNPPFAFGDSDWLLKCPKSAKELYFNTLFNI